MAILISENDDRPWDFGVEIPKSLHFFLIDPADYGVNHGKANFTYHP